MIALARDRHPEARLFHADICRWELPRSYDLIVAWDSVWHVPLAQQEAVLTKLCRGLSAGGVLVFTTGGTDAPAEKQDSCMGPPMYHATLGIPKTLQVLAEAGCVCRHLEYDQHPEASRLPHRSKVRPLKSIRTARRSAWCTRHRPRPALRVDPAEALPVQVNVRVEAAGSGVTRRGRELVPHGRTHPSGPPCLARSRPAVAGAARSAVRHRRPQPAELQRRPAQIEQQQPATARRTPPPRRSTCPSSSPPARRTPSR